MLPQGRTRFRGMLARPAMPRLASALLVHAAILAAVIWETGRLTQPEPRLPESTFAMVFTSPTPNKAAIAAAPVTQPPVPQAAEPPTAPAQSVVPPPVPQPAPVAQPTLPRPAAPPPPGPTPVAQPTTPPPAPPIRAAAPPAALQPAAAPPAPPPPEPIPSPRPPPMQTAAAPVTPPLPLPPPPAPAPPPRQVAARPQPAPPRQAVQPLTQPAPPQAQPAPAAIADGPANAGAAAASAAAVAVIPPRPIAAVAKDRRPVYPELARRRGEQGRVVLRVRVGPNGLPLAVTVDRTSGHASLDHAAMAAVRQWRFAPALEDGRPVAAVAEIPVQFRLSD